MVRTLALGLVALLASVGSAQDLRLRYQIGLLSNAKSAVPAAPGAAGTAHSFLLVNEKGYWARFNWPLFRPVPGLQAVSFFCRKEADGPDSMLVRVLGRDGIEWQSDRITLTEKWQQHRLTAESFKYFRGDESRRGDKPDFATVMQFQVVPSSSGTGDGAFRLDEIRLEPGGPAYTADGDDLVTPLAPQEAERQRIEDLIGRWRYERNRLARDARQARAWRKELWLLLASDARAKTRLAERQSPWQQPLPPIEEATFSLPKEAFARLLDDLKGRPVQAIDLASPDNNIRASCLYEATTPAPPERVTEGGRPVLRQVIHFAPKDTRQTVFLDVYFPKPIDVRGHVLEIDVRFPKVPLNADYPFLVRLWGKRPDGRESWADLPPDELPNGSWQRMRFDVANPLRQVRYVPESIIGLSFRLENQPGTGGDFPLEVGSARLDWPPAEQIARDQLLNQELDAVHRDRLTLYRLRDQIAAAENLLAKQPDLRRRYFASFAPAASVTTATVPVLDPAVRAAKPAAEGRFSWAYRPAPAGVALHVELAKGTANEKLLAEVHDGAQLVASATVAGNEPLDLPLPTTAYWGSRRPESCTLQLAAVSGPQVTARTTATIQPGVVTVGPGPVTPTLRHLRQHGQPDWTMRENGRAWFPRMACYNWSNLAATVQQGHRLLDDLWVDGLRRYGLSNRPGAWDAQDKLGVPFLHSLAPGYRTLNGWQDIATFREHYTTLFGLLSEHANRPFQAVVQAGNEVELACWGASLPAAFPGALYQPLDLGAELLGKIYARRSPVMYVRAGHFRSVPPLPHEDISGVNQYTGRYSGREDEVARDLAELAREAAFCDRPIMITEWMGPKYSWATGGVGGVTRRGAAYYLEKYWRAMIETPGIVGSSEFTMNWVIAPFEDLTTQTHEEAWKNRPKHSGFGGGHTADHVPLVGPADAVHGPCFRSMQAFQSPLYIMANSPGPIGIVFSPRAAERAGTIAQDLGRLGKRSVLSALADTRWRNANGHRLVLLHPDDTLPAGLPLDPGDLATDEVDEPLVRQRLRPDDPDRLEAILSAPDAAAFDRGAQRLQAAAADLVELRELEGAMSRIVALTDGRFRRVYERYILELVARGYAFTGDDTREQLDPAEFFAPDGSRRVAWQRLSAMILDTTRQLEPQEWRLVERLLAEGVHVIASLPCWQANPALQTLMPATVGAEHSMGEVFPLVDAVRQPIPVRHLGGADLAVIRRFRPKQADSPALRLHELASPNAQALARTTEGKPVALAWSRGKARLVLLGSPIGEVAEIQWRVTHAGLTHPIYDRDTACGLERLSRFVVNCCRFGQPERAMLPRLFATVEPESTIVTAGQPVRARIRLTDVEGQPVPGAQLRVRVRANLDGRHGRSTAYSDLQEAAPGVFDVVCPAGADAAGPHYSLSPSSGRLRTVSLQFKAFAANYVPADAAVAVTVETPAP
jgi:hypothetical protein